MKSSFKLSMTLLSRTWAVGANTFRRLALRDLERRRTWKQVFDAGNEKGRKMGITSEQQVYDAITDFKRNKNAQ